MMLITNFGHRREGKVPSLRLSPTALGPPHRPGPAARHLGAAAAASSGSVAAAAHEGDDDLLMIYADSIVNITMSICHFIGWWMRRG